MSSPNTSIAMAASLHCISVSESGIEVGGGGDGGTEEENLIVSLCVFAMLPWTPRLYKMVSEAVVIATPPSMKVHTAFCVFVLLLHCFRIVLCCCLTCSLLLRRGARGS